MSGKHVATKNVHKINNGKGIRIAAGSALALAVVIGAPTVALAAPATDAPATTSTESAFIIQDAAVPGTLEAEVSAPAALADADEDVPTPAPGGGLVIEIDPPIFPIEPPVEPVEPPVVPVEPPVEPTEPPVVPVEPPVEPPVVPTEPPVVPALPPVQPTIPPVQAPAAPAQPTVPAVVVPAAPGAVASAGGSGAVVPRTPAGSIPLQPVYTGTGVGAGVGVGAGGGMGAGPAAYQGTATGTSLAYTGANDSSLILAAGGLGALLLGGAALRVGRRSSTASTSGGDHV